jgi:hypothetical protein
MKRHEKSGDEQTESLDSVQKLSRGNRPSGDISSLRVDSIARLRGTPAWPRIEAIHGLLRKGDDREELNFPFRNVPGIEEQADAFAAKYGPVTTSRVINDAERSEAQKIRPYTRLPWKQWEDAPLGYYEYSHPSVSFADLTSAARSFLNANEYVMGMSALNFDDSVARMRKGTNLGMPYLTSSPEAWNGPIFREYLSRANRITLGKGARLEPFFMFWRITQGKRGETNKHRIVWGADHAETIAMLPYLYPVLDTNGSKPGFRAFLGSQRYIPLIKELRSALPPRHVWISGDVSRKDQSTHPDYVKFGFDLWEDMVPEVARVRDLLSVYYTEGELVTPNGILGGKHGRPSGIVPTGLFNTLDMISCVSLFWLEHGLDIKDLILEAHGDDFFFACPEGIVDDFWPFAKKCGWEVNPEKSLTDGILINYLQRYWSPNNAGLYPISRVLAHLMYSERVQPTMNVGSNKVQKIDADKSMLMLQLYSRLENAAQHPSFESLIEFVGNLDRFGLDPAIIGSRWKLREVLSPHTLGTPDNDRGLESTATYAAVIKLRQEGKITPRKSQVT